MKTFPLDLALSFSLFMQCMWILLRERPSRLVFSDTEGSLLGLGQQSPPSIPFPQAQMDANPSCTVKSRGNSLPFLPRMRLLFLPRCVVQCIQLGVCPGHSKHGMEDGAEARLEGAKEGGREGRRGQRGRKRGKRRELDAHLVGGRGRVGAAPRPRCKMGSAASTAKLRLPLG